MTGYDEAASNQPRHFALMDGYQSTHLVMYHFETADLRLGVVFPPEKDRLQERRFHSNNQVWEAILRERIQPPMRMTLESFFCSTGSLEYPAYTSPMMRVRVDSSLKAK